VSDATRARAKTPAKEEAAMFRRAAEEALDQLDWCVEYLYHIRKPGLARAVGKNRSAIRRRMSRGED
jgi:hypothetical protein